MPIGIKLATDRPRAGFSLAAGAGEAVDAVTTNYITAINAERSTLPDFTETETAELDAFIKSLKGSATADYPLAADLWADLRVLALTDPTWGVGEGTTLIPVIADDGSGNPVDPSDANQEDGELVNGAPWDDWFDKTNDYIAVPFPQVDFPTADYTVVFLMLTGNSTGVNTLVGQHTTGETTNTANGSTWRWFSSGRFDGFGGSNKIGASADISHTLLKGAFARRSLSEFILLRNGQVERNATLPSASATQPTEIRLGYEASLPSAVNPFGVAIFDRALSRAEIAAVHASLDRLRVSQKTGGKLLLNFTGPDALLLEDATTDNLLLDDTGAGDDAPAAALQAAAALAADDLLIFKPAATARAQAVRLKDTTFAARRPVGCVFRVLNSGGDNYPELLNELGGGNHEAIGIDSIAIDATKITLNFDRTHPAIGTVRASPDEGYNGRYRFGVDTFTDRAEITVTREDGTTINPLTDATFSSIANSNIWVSGSMPVE